MTECIPLDPAQPAYDISDPTCGADYVLSACRFTAIGLSALLSNSGRKVVELAPSRGTPFFPITQTEGPMRIIVWLPVEVSPLLQTLEVLVQVLSMRSMSIDVLIMSTLNPAWLWRTLQRQVPGRSRLAKVSALGAHLPCSQLGKMLTFVRREQLPLLSVLAKAEEKVNGATMEGLTPRELTSLLELFDGNSVKEQSAKEKLSPKTLYSQRMSGLKKLSTQIPAMAAQVPGMHRIVPAQRLRGLSPDEVDFYDAVQRGWVYPKFQPIVNKEMKIVGFEVLTRWFRNGHELQPAEFLLLLRSQNTWMLLTAFVINVAVTRINQFGGRVYFSVNISPGIAESNALIRMADTAKKRLENAAWADRLVLEFSEHTHLTPNARALITLKHLREKGYSVFLDDCFSEGNVMFPVRHVQFSGYKLDMSLVNRVEHDDDDRKLTEGITYYCRLTGKVCIAEGVDTPSKLTILKALGVEYFQGYLISHPVPAEDLEAVAIRFGIAAT